MAIETIRHEKVWIMNPTIRLTDYPSVNWEDRQAVMKDGRFGSWVDTVVFGVADADVSAAAADGDVTESEMSGVARLAKPLAGLGILALLLM